ncbi:MAG: LPS export ABC transporter periplasmic protein LptC [Bdellovibrionaceae bacterium]|nr:LPS export ABC transporter periplasmic protein LptC [Bdellovibrio sp.]
MEILIISPKVLEKPTEEHVEYEKILALANSKKKSSVEQKMMGLHLVENSDNKKGWELFATEALGTNDSQWVLKKVRVQFFSQDQSNFTVTGDVGEIDGASRDLVIRGNVITTSSNGYSFKTDSLHYVSKLKQMSSPDTVHMEGPPDRKGTGFKLTGQGLLVDVTENQMNILDAVEATKIIDNKNFKLTSNTAEFSNKNHEALFAGEVKMKLGPSNLEAPRAFFKYSQSAKVLESILLNQGVRLVEGDKRATSEELEINLVEDKMTLRGQPKVQQGSDEIRGQEIVFLEGGKKVKINQVNVKGKPPK